MNVAVENLINPREYVLSLFEEAVREDESIEVYPEENNSIGYFVPEYGYERYYYFNENPETLENRILMDPEVEAFLNKTELANFILEHIDANALMVMEKLVVVFDDEDNPSPSRTKLEEEYANEYAWYIAEDFLGQTWVDRQIVVINFSELIESSLRIVDEPDEYLSAEDILQEGFLQTLFHEFRHLFYECNEIVPIGEETLYPQNGGLEDEVECYGNRTASKYLSDFIKQVLQKDYIIPTHIKEVLIQS